MNSDLHHIGAAADPNAADTLRRRMAEADGWLTSEGREGGRNAKILQDRPRTPMQVGIRQQFFISGTKSLFRGTLLSDFATKSLTLNGTRFLFKENFPSTDIWEPRLL